MQHPNKLQHHQQQYGQQQQQQFAQQQQPFNQQQQSVGHQQQQQFQNGNDFSFSPPQLGYGPNQWPAGPPYQQNNSGQNNQTQFAYPYAQGMMQSSGQLNRPPPQPMFPMAPMPPVPPPTSNFPQYAMQTQYGNLNSGNLQQQKTTPMTSMVKPVLQSPQFQNSAIRQMTGNSPEAQESISFRHSIASGNKPASPPPTNTSTLDSAKHKTSNQNSSHRRSVTKISTLPAKNSTPVDKSENAVAAKIIYDTNKPESSNIHSVQNSVQNSVQATEVIQQQYHSKPGKDQTEIISKLNGNNAQNLGSKQTSQKTGEVVSDSQLKDSVKTYQAQQTKTNVNSQPIISSADFGSSLYEKTPQINLNEQDVVQVSQEKTIRNIQNEQPLNLNELDNVGETGEKNPPNDFSELKKEKYLLLLRQNILKLQMETNADRLSQIQLQLLQHNQNNAEVGGEIEKQFNAPLIQQQPGETSQRMDLGELRKRALAQIRKEDQNSKQTKQILDMEKLDNQNIPAVNVIDNNQVQNQNIYELNTFNPDPNFIEEAQAGKRQKLMYQQNMGDVAQNIIQNQNLGDYNSQNQNIGQGDMQPPLMLPPLPLSQYQQPPNYNFQPENQYFQQIQQKTIVETRQLQQVQQQNTVEKQQVQSVSPKNKIQKISSAKERKKKVAMQISLGSFQPQNSSLDGSIDMLYFQPVDGLPPCGFKIVLNKNIQIPRGFSLDTANQITFNNNNSLNVTQHSGKNPKKYKSFLRMIKFYQFTELWAHFGDKQFSLDLKIEPNWPMCRYDVRGQCRDFKNCQFQMKKNYHLTGDELTKYQKSLISQIPIAIPQKSTPEVFENSSDLVKKHQIKKLSSMVNTQKQGIKRKLSESKEEFDGKEMTVYRKFMIQDDRINNLSLKNQLQPANFGRNTLEMLSPGHGAWKLFCQTLTKHPDLQTQRSQNSNSTRNSETRYYKQQQDQFLDKNSGDKDEKQGDSEFQNLQNTSDGQIFEDGDDPDDDDDDDHAIMQALKDLQFGRAFGQHLKTTSVLQHLIMALEKNNRSSKLYPFYLEIFQLQIGQQKEFGILQQIIDKLIQEGTYSYTLAITVTQISKTSELRIQMLTQSIVQLVYKMGGNSAAEFEERSDCVLDLSLRLLNELCVGGEEQAAKKWIQGLVEDLQCTMVPEEEAEIEKITEQNLQVACRRAVIRCLSFHLEQACVFWMCCGHIVVYDKLPLQVVHRFGYKQAAVLNDWYPLPSTLSASNRSLLVEIMRQSCRSERMCIPLLPTSLVSKPFQQTRQVMALNAILFDYKLLPGFVEQLMQEEDEFEPLQESELLDNAGLQFLLQQPDCEDENVEQKQRSSSIIYMRYLAAEIVHDWISLAQTEHNHWPEWLVKILVWVAWIHAEAQQDSFTKIEEKSRKVKEHQVVWYSRAIVALNSVSKHACIRVLAKGASGAGHRISDVEDVDSVHDWFLGVVDENEFRRRRASALTEEGEILDEDKVLLDRTGQLFGLLNLSLYQCLVGRTEDGYESLCQALNLSQGTPFYWTVVQNLLSYFLMGANDKATLQNQQESWSGWKTEESNNKCVVGSGQKRCQLFKLFLRVLSQIVLSCEELQGLQYPKMHFKHDEVEELLSPPSAHDWTPVNQVSNQLLEYCNNKEIFMVTEMIAKRCQGNPGCVQFLLSAYQKLICYNPKSVAWSIPLCYSALGSSIPFADETLWYQFINVVANQQQYLLESTAREIGEAAIAICPGSRRIWKKLLDICKGEDDRRELERWMTVYGIQLT